MTLNHVHLRVSDLSGALEWFQRVWGVSAEFQTCVRAGLPFGAFMLILDLAETDSVATLGFASADCDNDFNSALARGAVAIDAPSNKPWGARTAYIQGPGRVTLEIEEPANNH